MSAVSNRPLPATSKGWVTIACPSEETWQSLARTIDPALLSDERFSTMELRKRNEAELDQIIEAWTRTGDRWGLTHRLQAAGVAAMPSLSPLDLWSGDPQLDAVGMLERPPHPITGEHVVAGIPWRTSVGPNGIRRPGPTLGQHTDEVLTDLLGFSPDEVATLRTNGALG